MGGGVPEMLERASGVDLLDMIFTIALGGDVRVPGPVSTQRIGYRFFLQPPDVSATVASIEGLDSVSDYPGVPPSRSTSVRGPTWTGKTVRAITLSPSWGPHATTTTCSK